MAVEDARRAARVLIGEAAIGDGEPASVPTIQTFGPAFLADCAERWKPATRTAHAHYMQRFILPAFGNRRVEAITARDVRTWFDELSVTPDPAAGFPDPVSIDRLPLPVLRPAHIPGGFLPLLLSQAKAGAR